MAKETTMLRLSLDLRDRLKYQAVKERTTMVAIIQKAMDNYQTEDN